MTNTDTVDASSTALQVEELARAGSLLVRVTVNNDEAARAVPEIASRLADMGVVVPLIGDFHYNGHLLLAKYPATARALAKYRINPGNVGGKRRDENFRTRIRPAHCQRGLYRGDDPECAALGIYRRRDRNQPRPNHTVCKSLRRSGF